MNMFINKFFRPEKGLIYTYFFLFFFSVYIGIINFYPFKTFDIIDITIEQPAYVGENLSYNIRYIKYRPVEGTVSRQLVDGHIIHYPTIKSNVEVTDGNEKILHNTVSIPDYIKPGTYVFITTNEYELDFPFISRIIKKRYTSSPFEIREKPL